ncbi:hypothetical protein DOY81_004153, partial [Sarcophaga bullata]
MINCLSVEVVYLYYLDKKSLLDVATRLFILMNVGGAAATAANSAAAFVA